MMRGFKIVLVTTYSLYGKKKENEMNRMFISQKTEGNSRKTLTIKPEGKASPGRPRRKWENIIKKRTRMGE
jgi:hypothetical protein